MAVRWLVARRARVAAQQPELKLDLELLPELQAEVAAVWLGRSERVLATTEVAARLL